MWALVVTIGLYIFEGQAQPFGHEVRLFQTKVACQVALKQVEYPKYGLCVEVAR